MSRTRRRIRRPIRVLLTGFEPFGGSAVNPSQKIVEAMAARRGEFEGLDLHTRVLPVEARRGPAMLLKAVDAIRPRMVLCLGETARAQAITFERVFINLADYRLADNAGAKLRNQPIAPRGPAAYFATLPLEELHAAVEASGVRAAWSLSAGSFLCNHAAYALLHHVRRREVAAGFVHVPRLPEQLKPGDGSPSMLLARMVRAIEAVLHTLAKLQAADRRR